MTSPDDTEPDLTEPDTSELKHEIEELRDELEQVKQRRRRGGRGRSLMVGIGVFLTCVMVIGAVLGVWGRRSLLNTEVFSERAGSLVDQPEVQDSLGRYLSEQVNELIDAQSLIEETLPEEAGVLAGPLSSAVEGFVADQVNSFVASDEFAGLWKGAVSLAHGAAVDLLEDDSEVLETDSDTITINLIPVINQVLTNVTETSPEIFGQEVTLPDVTLDDLPDDARQKIEEATGLELDDDFGTFTIYDDGALAAAQEGVKITNTLVFAMVALVPILMAATIWLSRRRRRTILQLAAGVTVGMVLIRRITFFFQDDLLELVKVDANRGAVRVTSETFIGPLQTGAYWVGITALVVAAVAWITGPYPWAVSVRDWARRTYNAVVGAATDQAENEAARAWVRRNEDALRIGGWVALVAGLLLLSLSWLTLIILVAVIAAYMLVLQRMAEDDDDDDDGSDGSDEGEGEVDVSVTA